MFLSNYGFTIFNNPQEKRYFHDSNVLSGTEIRDIILSKTTPVSVPKTGPWPSTGFRMVTKTLFGFKKIRNNRIVNLIIPQSSIIFVDNYNWTDSKSHRQFKFRSNQAKVESIWCPNVKKMVSDGVSLWDSKFKYKAGTLVIPTHSFSFVDDSCRSGIHFFLTAYEAMIYN